MGAPPPLPPPQAAPIVRHAAVASTILAFVSLVVIAVAGTLSSSSTDGSHRALHYLGNAFSLITLLMSVVLGVIAMISINQGQRARSHQVFAWVGVLASLGLLGTFGYGTVKTWGEALRFHSQLADLRQTIREVRTEQQERLNTPGSANAKSVPSDPSEGLAKIQTKAKVLARESTGINSLAMQVTSDFLFRLQQLTKEYEKSAKVLQDRDVTNPSTLNEQIDLAPRRVIVRGFLDANDRLREYLSHSEETLRADLAERQVPAESQKQFLDGFRKSMPSHELVLKIRQTDQRIGDATLAILNLYDREWGGWRFDKESRRIIFQSDSALEQFQTLSREIKTSANEQKELQQKLTNASTPPR